MAFSEYPIHVDQLCPGLFIHFGLVGELSSKGPKGVKIANEKQIEEIKRSGVKHVICVLNKSDRLPLPLEQAELKAIIENRQPPVLVKSPVGKELLGLKKKTLERNKERRMQYARCEKRYDETVGRVSALLRRASGRSSEAVVEARKVVDALTDTFLSERDVIIGLMTSKPKEDKQHLHALNVTILSMMVGKECKLDAQSMGHLGMGAMFHDIGKGRMPVSELTMGKATSLRFAVQRYYEQHPRMGARIATELQDFPQHSAVIILQHHETLDGKGFPARLAKGDIFPLSRIVTIANAYDNLCNRSEPGKEPLTPHEALKHLFTRQRQALDNRFLSIFIRNLGIYPPGSIVQLSNGALGMVISTNIEKSIRPSVLVYHPDVPKNEALIVDLLVEEELEIKKTLRAEELPREVFAYLSPTRQISYYAEAQ